MTPNWAATTLSVSTTNPADVGTHEMIVHVTLTDYPSLKKTVWKTVYFNVTIDSECLHTSIDWTDPALRHLVFSDAVTFQLVLNDVYSESVADLEFCGPKTYTLVSKTGPDPSVLAWDAVDTFSLEGLEMADCGWYKAVFTVTLDWYPDFPASSTTLTGEVVPNCQLSQISITTPLVFATIPLSSWS